MPARAFHDRGSACSCSISRDASSMTGPTSVARSQRIADAQFVHVARQQLGDARRDLFLHEQHAQRRAALARAVESRLHHVEHDLLGQRRAVDDHRVLPAGLGDQHRDRSVAIRQRLMDRFRGFGRARERDAGDARIGDDAVAPTLAPSPGNRCSAPAARRPPAATAPRASRSAASARPASRCTRCRPRAPLRSGP